MSTFEANRERTVRSIELRLRGLSITAEQADRLLTAIRASAATTAWNPRKAD